MTLPVIFAEFVFTFKCLKAFQVSNKRIGHIYGLIVILLLSNSWVPVRYGADFPCGLEGGLIWITSFFFFFFCFFFGGGGGGYSGR